MKEDGGMGMPIGPAHKCNHCEDTGYVEVGRTKNDVFTESCTHCKKSNDKV